MRALGVGLVYWAELSPLFDEGNHELPVLELEPQSLWELALGPGGPRYRVNEALFDSIQQKSQAKLLHGVGHPVGGTVPDPIEYLSLLRAAVDRLDPVWVSEHLSFNRVASASDVEHAGFLLPPLQTEGGARVAADNLIALHRALGRPVAFETGVNYLAPRADETDDGRHFAAVAESADCGILLDLHNLWCNQRNGRQSVLDTLEQLPLDRVWELHLAGGMQAGGRWLDAHSGPVPAQVLDIAAALVPRLPNLGAIIFEILPEHLPNIGLDGVRRQLEALQAIWALRPAREIRLQRFADSVRPVNTSAIKIQDRLEVAAWETALVSSIRTPGECRGDYRELSDDPGTALYRELIVEFRRANLARVMRYTMSLLILGLGSGETCTLLDAYTSVRPPEPFAALEADHFATFLSERLPRLMKIPLLGEVLAFEHALIRASLHGRSSEIVWSVDPTALIERLDAGRPPEGLPAVPSRMQIVAA